MLENTDWVNSKLEETFFELHNKNQSNLENINLIMLSFEGKDMSTLNINEFIKNKINELKNIENNLIEINSNTKEKINWLNNTEFASMKNNKSNELIIKIENLLTDNIKIQNMATNLIFELNKLI